MGTGDFTIEMYVYSTDSSTDTQDRRFFATEANATSSIQVRHINTTAGIVEYADQGSTNIRVTGTTSILNKWAHVAVVRNSGTVSLYIDGKSEGTPATDSNSKTASTPTIGKYPGASGHFKGFLSNIRVLKGTALYTSNFTPPAAPLTNVTNTKLLCCQSNTFAGAAAASPSVNDDYSAGVYLTDTVGSYSDRGGSSCTVTNNGSITSSSAGTNPFGLTNAADMTGTQRIDLDMGNVSSTFFQSAWTLEMFFKTSDISDNWFVGSATDGSSYTTGW